MSAMGFNSGNFSLVFIKHVLSMVRLMNATIITGTVICVSLFSAKGSRQNSETDAFKNKKSINERRYLLCFNSS